MLVAASAHLADEDSPHVALVACVEDDNVPALDTLSGALRQVVGFEFGRLDGVAVLKGDLKLKVQIVHTVLLAPNLETGLSHPEAHSVPSLSKR